MNREYLQIKHPDSYILTVGEALKLVVGADYIRTSEQEGANSNVSDRIILRLHGEDCDEQLEFNADDPLFAPYYDIHIYSINATEKPHTLEFWICGEDIQEILDRNAALYNSFIEIVRNKSTGYF